MTRPDSTTTRTPGDEIWRDRGSGKAWVAAVLSHELTTPLNAILGSISLLDGESSTDRCGLVLVDRKHIDRMRRNGSHLRATINGVLKLLRAEAGALDVSLVRGDLRAVVDDALADVELAARARGVTIVNGVANLADELSYWGDETFVRHILVNLLANAVKFTGTGGRVVLTAGRDERGPSAAVDKSASTDVLTRRGQWPRHSSMSSRPDLRAISTSGSRRPTSWQRAGSRDQPAVRAGDERRDRSNQ